MSAPGQWVKDADPLRWCQGADESMSKVLDKWTREALALGPLSAESMVAALCSVAEGHRSSQTGMAGWVVQMTGAYRFSALAWARLVLDGQP